MHVSVVNKQKQTKNNIDWSEYASTLDKAPGASNKGINSREDFNVLIRSQISKCRFAPCQFKAKSCMYLWS
jgi:hypothetical protein